MPPHAQAQAAPCLEAAPLDPTPWALPRPWQEGRPLPALSRLHPRPPAPGPGRPDGRPPPMAGDRAGPPLVTPFLVTPPFLVTLPPHGRPPTAGRPRVTWAAPLPGRSWGFLEPGNLGNSGMPHSAPRKAARGGLRVWAILTHKNRTRPFLGEFGFSLCGNNPFPLDIVSPTWAAVDCSQQGVDRPHDLAPCQRQTTRQQNPPGRPPL